MNKNGYTLQAGQKTDVNEEVSRSRGNSNDTKMEDIEKRLEGEEGLRQVGKKGKSNKITRTPTRPGVQVTPNKKTVAGHMQEPPKKSRYNNGQLEAFFGPGTRVIVQDNKTGRPARTKKPAKMSKGSNKKARLDHEHSDGSNVRGKGFQENLEALDTPLRGKGSSKITSTKTSLKATKIASNVTSTVKKKGKKATFAEAVSAETPLQPETSKKEGVVYQKCIVGFMIRVDKGQKSKENFDKKVREALFFLRTHIDEESCFRLLSANKTLRPIKEKSDMPKFQVTSRKYFSIPNPQAFSPVTQDGGRAIKGSGIMGFQGDPQTCLDKAAVDLRMLNCSIFYKNAKR
jgi:hypothetical protein